MQMGCHCISKFLACHTSTRISEDDQDGLSGPDAWVLALAFSSDVI